jgi:hypothetical protein
MPNAPRSSESSRLRIWKSVCTITRHVSPVVELVERRNEEFAWPLCRAAQDVIVGSRLYILGTVYPTAIPENSCSCGKWHNATSRGSNREANRNGSAHDGLRRQTAVCVAFTRSQGALVARARPRVGLQRSLAERARRRKYRNNQFPAWLASPAATFLSQRRSESQRLGRKRLSWLAIALGFKRQ